MHILFIHQIFLSPDEAGSTRHFELARYLTKRGHRVTIIASTVSYLTGSVSQRFRGKFIYRENVEGVEIFRIWAYPEIHESYIKRFWSFISFMVSSILGGLVVGKIDIIIACSPQIFTGISGYILSKIKRVPFIFEIRDLWPKFAIETRVLTNQTLIFLAGLLEKFIYKKADYFIINSPGFYGHLDGFNIPRNRIFLIPNGVDTNIFKPGIKYNTVRKKLNLDGKFVVMYAGAHGRANGLDTVIESARLLKDYAGIIFLLIGNGKEKQRLMKLKDDLGLANLLFIDAQPKNKMPEFCNAADAGLAILLKREAFKTVFPNKVFDYMACGIPTILAIDGVIRRVLEESQAGVYVEPEDARALAEAVLNLYRNRNLLERYGINARRYALEHFDRSKISGYLNEVLCNIVEGQ